MIKTTKSITAKRSVFLLACVVLGLSNTAQAMPITATECSAQGGTVESVPIGEAGPDFLCTSTGAAPTDAVRPDEFTGERPEEKMVCCGGTGDGIAARDGPRDGPRGGPRGITADECSTQGGTVETVAFEEAGPDFLCTSTGAAPTDAVRPDEFTGERPDEWVVCCGGTGDGIAARGGPRDGPRGGPRGITADECTTQGGTVETVAFGEGGPDFLCSSTGAAPTDAVRPDEFTGERPEERMVCCGGTGDGIAPRGGPRGGPRGITADECTTQGGTVETVAFEEAGPDFLCTSSGAAPTDAVRPDEFTGERPDEWIVCCGGTGDGIAARGGPRDGPRDPTRARHLRG